MPLTLWPFGQGTPDARNYSRLLWTTRRRFDPSSSPSARSADATFSPSDLDGNYPTTSLREARDAHDDARRLLSSGQDPSLIRKLDKAAKVKASANTFNSLADELLEKKRAEGRAEHTFDKRSSGC
jgi:hypothetical protein